MCGLYLKRFKIMLATCASLLVVKIGYVMCGVSNFTMFKTPIACIALGTFYFFFHHIFFKPETELIVAWLSWSLHPLLVYIWYIGRVTSMKAIQAPVETSASE
jgi:hypothetical protein